jgi:hypothetical protein
MSKVDYFSCFTKCFNLKTSIIFLKKTIHVNKSHYLLVSYFIKC